MGCSLPAELRVVLVLCRSLSTFDRWSWCSPCPAQHEVEGGLLAPGLRLSAVCLLQRWRSFAKLPCAI